MLKRLNYVSLTLLFLVSAGCGPGTKTSTTIPTDRYAESVNSASGTFFFEGFSTEEKKPVNINISQAYARVVRNLDDPTKRDVLILLLEKPISRFALAVVENDDEDLADQDLSRALHQRDARGFVIRLDLDRKTPEAAEPKIRTYFDGSDAHLGNLELEIKSVSADKIDGHIDANLSSLKADVNFSVKIQPDLWTGGVFYQQPPTGLAAGQASGQLEIDGQAVKINHAYARLIDLDLFDETKNVFRVWLTEKPVDQKVLFDENASNLLAMKQSGNGIIFSHTTIGPADLNEPTIWLVGEIPDGTNDAKLQGLDELFDRVPAIASDYVRYDQSAIEGRFYTAFPVVLDGKREYNLDLLFNAAMLPPAVTDGPVTAGNGGTALPSDGGAPAKAYLAAMERMKSANAAKDVDQALAVWLSAVSAANAEKLKRDLESLPADKRHVLLELFAPLNDARLASGFIKDNKATLSFTGTGPDGKAIEVVNLQLEDGAWKIGRREIRED